MHEWSLAQAVVYSAIKYKKKNKLKKISEINLKIGELQQIDRDIFKFSLKQIGRLKKITGKIKIKTEKAILKCRICQHQWSFSKILKKLNKNEAEYIHFIPEIAHTYLRCPKCKSPDFKIIKGRGVWIDSIK